MTYRFLRCWVDGGVLGKNPSPKGVYWSAYVEGGPTPEPVMIRRRSSEYHTNQDAEWLALHEVLKYIVTQRIDQPVVIHSDSKVIVNQFNGVQQISVEHQRVLFEACKDLATHLPWVALKWVNRDQIVAKVGH